MWFHTVLKFLVKLGHCNTKCILWVCWWDSCWYLSRAGIIHLLCLGDWWRKEKIPWFRFLVPCEWLGQLYSLWVWEGSFRSHIPMYAFIGTNLNLFLKRVYSFKNCFRFPDDTYFVFPVLQFEQGKAYLTLLKHMAACSQVYSQARLLLWSLPCKCLLLCTYQAYIGRQGPEQLDPNWLHFEWGIETDDLQRSLPM